MGYSFEDAGFVASLPCSPIEKESRIDLPTRQHRFA